MSGLKEVKLYRPVPVVGPSASVGTVTSSNTCISSALRRSALPCVVDSEKIELGETRALIGSIGDRRTKGFDPQTTSGQGRCEGGRFRRDLRLFGLGSAVAVICALVQVIVSRWTGASLRCEPRERGRGPARPAKGLPADEDEGSTFAFDDVAGAGGDSRRLAVDEDSRFAFVTMAYDPPGEPQAHLWRSLTLVRAVREVSRYPLVLLSNSSDLSQGGSLNFYLSRMGVRIAPVHEVALPPNGARQMRRAWQVAFWKLQIWSLTEYTRIVWLDTDTVVYRGLDDLFLRKPVLGIQCERTCAPLLPGRKARHSALEEQEEALCGAVMLIEPSAATLRDMLSFAGKYDAWVRRGDQQLVLDYFRYVAKQPVQTLELSVAAPGACLEMGLDPALLGRFAGRVPWVIPAVVHRSSGRNECFDYHIEAQRTMVTGEPTNMCTYHPLGAYWRDLFCDAAHAVGTHAVGTDLWPSVAEFCVDEAWYAHGMRNRTAWLQTGALHTEVV